MMEKENLKKKIEELKKEIDERELDRYYADSWEQASQITRDIEEMKKELETLKQSLNKKRRVKINEQTASKKI